MLSFDFGAASSGPRRLLCLGAHCDDIEIGCGGTVLRLTEAFPELAVDWVVLTSDETRGREAHASAQAFLHRVERKRIVVKTFRDGFLPYSGGEVKEFFETLKDLGSPDLILTHYRHDLHQDHRLVSDLTWNTFRNHLILEYEIPKYDGDFGVPNLFVHLDEGTCQQKVDYITAHFATQQGRSWFSADTFLAVMRLRGMESRAPAGYAEAFYCRKLIWPLRAP